MCDSIYQSTLQALYGTLFFENKEAAFSNRNLWKSLGSVLGIFFALGLCHHIVLSIWLWPSLTRLH